jgi:AcrR family transcriptional regulator
VAEPSLESGSSPTESSLRERKRAASQAAIERAAITLALEHGYENVTVDMICDASLVSPRTFFNYFGSKEGVILGTPPALPDDDAVRRFVSKAGGETLSDFMAMFSETLVTRHLDRDLQQARYELIARTPELTLKRSAVIGNLEDKYVQIVRDRLRSEGGPGVSAGDVEDEARMIIALATGVTSYATRKWFSPGFSGSVQELLADAIDLVRRVVTDNTPRTAYPKSTA